MLARPQPRLAVVAEELSARADEGVLNFLAAFLRHASSRRQLRAFHTRGEAPPGIDAQRVPMAKLSVTRELAAALRDFSPDRLLYVPSASATPNAFWRHRLLARHAGTPGATLLALQARDYRWWQVPLVRCLRPPALVMNSERAAARYRGWGWAVRVLAQGVDPERFRPVSAQRRSELRQRRGWPADRPVLLHVGHLRSGRGLDMLADLSRSGLGHVVVVGSTSTPVEPAVLATLQHAGVQVVREYLPRVEELYQAADLYLFPVAHQESAIEFPLSVLEAMATGLPVVARPFGALPERFAGVAGFHLLADGEDPVDACRRLLGVPVATREAVLPLSWERVCSNLLEELER